MFCGQVGRVLDGLQGAADVGDVEILTEDFGRPKPIADRGAQAETIRGCVLAGQPGREFGIRQFGVEIHAPAGNEPELVVEGDIRL